MPEVLREGQVVDLEEPYGGITFISTRKRQIWIGGGIGITPLFARMSQFVKNPIDMPIALFHTTREMDFANAQFLREAARSAELSYTQCPPIATGS